MADDDPRPLESLVLTNETCRDPVAFGKSVAIDGDTIMIGSPWGSHRKGESGHVVVYTLHAGEWEVTQVLFPPRPASKSLFGHDIALSGETAVISTLWSHGDHDSMNENPHDPSGVCYEFRKVDGEWIFLAEIVGSERKRYDNFGCSIDMDGNTLVVGANAGNYSPEQAGAVYVFVRGSNGRWKQQSRIVSDDPTTARAFGERVRISGGTLAILGGGGLQLPGSEVVHVYELAGAEWIKSATLSLPKEQYAGADGFDVCGNTIVVGDGTGSLRPLSPPSGAAWVFTRDNGAWKLAATIDPGPESELSDFGRTVVLDGNWVAIGAPSYDPPLFQGGGVVFLYERRAGEFKLVDRFVLDRSSRYFTSDHYIDFDAAARRVIIGEPGRENDRQRKCRATLVTLPEAQ